MLDALLEAASRAGVVLRAGERVVRLERTGAAWRAGLQHVSGSAVFGEGVSRAGATTFALPADEPDEWEDADAVILATGGLSFPRTGSDGTGYALALSLGHTLVPTVPALTPLVAVDPMCQSAQGVTLDAELALWVDGRVESRVHGSLLFAHFGVTGPAALDLSRRWHRAEGKCSARDAVVSRPANPTSSSSARGWTTLPRTRAAACARGSPNDCPSASPTCSRPRAAWVVVRCRRSRARAARSCCAD